MLQFFKKISFGVFGALETVGFGVLDIYGTCRFRCFWNFILKTKKKEVDKEVEETQRKEEREREN